MCRRPTTKKAAMYNGTSGSLVRIELLTLFHRNPGLAGTTAELAEAIGRDPDAVEEQIRKLTQLRILEEVRSKGDTVYRYHPPQALGRVQGNKKGKNTAVS